MKKMLILLAVLVLAIPFASAKVPAPTWKLTSMCDVYQGDAFQGHIMRARSESANSYNDVLWTLVGTANTGLIDLPGMNPDQVQVYFLVPQKGTVKLEWNGYSTVKAMNNNVCSDVDVCSYLGGEYCPQNEVPEFGFIGAALVAIGAIGFLVFRRK